MTGLMWLPYIINRVMELGPPPDAWYPPPDPAPRAAWAARAVRAHMNAVENLVLFAPLALAIHVTQSGTTVTGTASMVYFFARVAHYLIGIVGLPVPLRTAAFAAGFAAQMTLAVTFLSVQY